MRVLPGNWQALGARFDGEAVDFSIFSAHADRVELCLFEGAEGEVESHRLELPERTGDVWHGRVYGIEPGQLYGYRVHGPWAPDQGHRFNAAKLLVDPYARALHGTIRWNAALYGHDPDDPASPNPNDSAPYVPRSVVVDSGFDWGLDEPQRTPWSRTLVYETHVKGITARHPNVRAEARGRYAGVASPEIVSHLQALGVTAVELLPIHQAGVEEHLARRGFTNYWGYATLGFFAPDARFARGSEPAAAVDEFKAMITALHEAGIEVILDVVYNHTPEGGPLGPTFSFRGIDNASYYRLNPSNPSQYSDHTGTGHTVNTAHPRVRQLVLDSLRYWAQEMHVDGFRFDLAPAIARDHGKYDPDDVIFEMIRQDPVLSHVKLIAEPWDLGPGGYRLGGFPLGWSEWNDRFRDVTRRYWRGDGGLRGEIASRLAGSSDLFSAERGTTASVNFVCSHDGFTLRDLVSYSHKHNQANGEGGADGAFEESANWSVEGPSSNQRVIRMRDRARRNMTATLALACGVPMWLGGDELGRTQGGNNNAYCQDNEISWYDWVLDESDEDFLAFVRLCFSVRRENAIFRRRRHLEGPDSALATWFSPDGTPLSAPGWADPNALSLSLLLDADASEPEDETGCAQESRSALLLLNGDTKTRNFRIPAAAAGRAWVELINTACAHDARHIRKEQLKLAPHSLVLLEQRDLA